MKKFPLYLITPERTFYQGEATCLTVRDSEGERQILADHEPLVVNVPAAVVRVNDGEKTFVCANSEGFLSVNGTGVYLVCQTFERPDEIVPERVNRAIEEHKVLVDSSTDEYKKKFHQLTLERAYARMSLLALAKEKSKKI